MVDGGATTGALKTGFTIYTSTTRNIYYEYTICDVQVCMSRSKGTQRRVCCSSAVWVYSGGEGRSGVVVLVTECYGMWVYIMNDGRVSWGGGRGRC
mgnify:CR=1 FL=1